MSKLKGSSCGNYKLLHQLDNPSLTDPRWLHSLCTRSYKMENLK
jgi:hypothetical protein